MSFDPNGVGVANGNIFGFPVEEASADIVIIPNECRPQGDFKCFNPIGFFSSKGFQSV